MKKLKSMFVYLMVLTIPVGASQKVKGHPNESTVVPSAVMLLNEAIYYQNRGQSYLALAPLLKAYKQNQDSYQINLLLGWNFLQTNQSANAAFHYLKAQKAMPQALDPKLGMIRVKMLQNSWQESYELAKELVSKAPTHLVANEFLLQILLHQQNFQAALQVADQVLGFYPLNAYYLKIKADLLNSQNRTKEAESVLVQLAAATGL